VTSVGVIAHARKVLDGGLPELRESLRRHGVDDPPWRQVPKSKFAPKVVGELIDEGVDLLFVWGGDGIVQRSIDAVRKAPVTLAIVPAGTANLFASNLGIPKDLEAAVSIGLHGARRTLDVGSINGERFAVMAGTGFDAAMIRGAGGGMKEKLGRLSYVVTGMRAVRRNAIETRIEVDGLPWFRGPSTCVLVGNVGDVFGGLSAFPDARPDDGRLDVAVVTADSMLDWARTLGRTVAGDPSASPFVETTTAERIDVRLDKKAPYELDGGDRPKTKRLRIRAKPAAITVCVPERKDEP
jgi:diacylglycerol kinase (ATP)